MRIAIASGKGGAGKTSVASSLGKVWPRPAIMADADLEAPNLHLFLHPRTDSSRKVELDVLSSIDKDACDSCGACRDICRYGAIAKFGEKIMVFPDMCHGCGGCFAVCPKGATVAGKRELGRIDRGRSEYGAFLGGATRVGEIMTPPLLRALFRELSRIEAKAKEEGQSLDVLLDCPPGVSCPAMTVTGRSDAVLMVADSSPFGVHDFKLAYEAFSSLKVPLFCVINRAGIPGNEKGDKDVSDFCQEHGINLIASLPYTREAAVAYSKGTLLADISPVWERRFEEVAKKLLEGMGESQCVR